MISSFDIQGTTIRWLQSHWAQPNSQPSRAAAVWFFHDGPDQWILQGQRPRAECFETMVRALRPLNPQQRRASPGPRAIVAAR
jgi:hypothetical protein